MKAILTKYHGPTNTRGSRISAKAEGVPKLSIPYPHALSGEAVYRLAAEQLAERHGWLTGDGRPTRQRWSLVGGGLPDGSGYAFVFVPLNVRAEG